MLGVAIIYNLSWKDPAKSYSKPFDSNILRPIQSSQLQQLYQS